MYSNLRFFDNDSNELNLVWNEEIGQWRGVIYLPEVSTGLYEALTIYVLEEVKGQLGEDLYVKPIAESGGTVSFKFQFQDEYDSSEDIFLYGADSINGELFIRKDQYQTGLLQSSTVSTSTLNGYKVITGSMRSEPIMVQVALMSEVEGFHIRTLNVYEVVNGVSSQIAAIKVYGEVEGEDERLKILLTNIGMNFDDLDYYLFKDSNIQEQSPDFIILNQKRKELLLQASQIKPFIGTYKALLNAIDFFGYDKITLKEYWLNINEQSENFGKLKAVAIPNQDVVGFLADKNNGVNLPNSNQKKTSRLSLVYRLNEATGAQDEWGIPTVREVLDFSPDEVLIKLYGLKNKLQRDYLPLHAKIIDITGEGDYFSQYNQNVWNNQHLIKSQSAGIEFDVEKLPLNRDVYIEDLRKVDYRLTGINQDMNLVSFSDRSAIIESIQTFYDQYYDNNLDTFNTATGIPIGAPVVLNITELEDTWQLAEFTWMDAEDTGDHLLTWANWWHRGAYEIEWVVRGPRDYYKEFRGPIDEYYNFPLILPFDGVYSIDANIYDLYNVKSTKSFKDWISVKNKNIEVYALTQYAPAYIDWNSTKTWSIIGSSWEWTRENLIPVEDVIGTFYLTLDRANYINDAQFGPEFSTVRRYVDATQTSGFNETPGPYQWKNLDGRTWGDGESVTWKMTRVGADINSSFQIKVDQSLGHTNGHNLIIEQIDPVTNQTITDSYSITTTYPLNENDVDAWSNIAIELGLLDPIEHPLFAKYDFNAILVDDDNDPLTGDGPQGEDLCIYILAVSKEPSRSYDFSEVSFSNVAGGLISEKLHFESYNPSFGDTYIINSIADLPVLNHVTFSYDLTNMPGIIAQEWRLINNTLNINDIYYNNQWLTYLFKHKGYYTVELELTDLNGNKNKVTKNILNII